MTTYVLTGDWLCDQADIECDSPPSVLGESVLCDGMGVAVVEAPEDLPVTVRGVHTFRPTRPHGRADSPGVYRRKK